MALVQASLSLFLVLGLVAFGWGPARRSIGPGRDLAETVLLAIFGGALCFGALMWLLDLVGLPWSRPTLVILLGLGAGLSVAAAGRWRFAPRLDRWTLPHVSALLVFAVPAILAWCVHADFIYHWGQKAARNHLAAAVDYEFLSRPWNAHLHPDYPNLLPTLGAAATLVDGEIRWLPTAMLSLLWFAALLLALISIAEKAAYSPVGRCAAAGVAIWSATAFAIGYRQAGGADLPMCAAVAAAVALLIAEPRGRDFQVAVVAAFSAAVKIEGMAFAAILLVLHLVRCHPAGLRAWVRRLAILAAPSAVVVGYWLTMVVGFDLFLASNTGGFEWRRMPTVLAALWDVLRLDTWHGVTVVFAALPALLWWRRSRWAALALTGQLAFYIYAYAAGPVDTRHWIETSGARLLFHLVPSLLVLAIAGLDHWSGERANHGERM